MHLPASNDACFPIKCKYRRSCRGRFAEVDTPGAYGWCIARLAVVVERICRPSMVRVHHMPTTSAIGALGCLRMNMRSESGFTLLELLVTILLAAILVTIAIPSFRNMILDNEITATANALVVGLKVARSDALRESRDVSLCPDSPATTTPCDGTSWTAGWQVWADRQENGTPSATEVIRANGQSPSSIVIDQNGSTSPTAVEYLANGLNSTGKTITFSVCDTQRHNEQGVKITISGTGSVRSGTYKCS